MSNFNYAAAPFQANSWIIASEEQLMPQNWRPDTIFFDTQDDAPPVFHAKGAELDQNFLVNYFHVDHFALTLQAGSISCIVAACVARNTLAEVARSALRPIWQELNAHREFKASTVRIFPQYGIPKRVVEIPKSTPQSPPLMRLTSHAPETLKRIFENSRATRGTRQEPAGNKADAGSGNIMFESS